MNYPLFFIRPASAPIAPNISFPSGFYLLDQAKLSPTLTIDKDKVEELSDGTSQIATEKISLEAATFRCTKEFLATLKTMQNSLVDIVCFDIAIPKATVYEAYACRLSVSVLASDADSAIIKLTASKGFPPSALSNIFIEEQIPSGFGIVKGTITLAGNPLPGVTVTFDSNVDFSDITDSNGEYLILCPAGTHPVSCVAAGRTFPGGLSVTSSAQQIITYNVAALS